MSFRWKNCPEVMCVLDIFDPDDYWSEENQLIKYKYQVNWYSATLNDDTKFIANAVVGWSPKTNTLHIEYFSIDPSIRGKGLSYNAWNSLLDFVQMDLHIVQTDNVLIEAYFNNMKVNLMNINEYVTKNTKKSKL